MKSKLKNVLLMGLSLVLVAVIAIGGTVAYLTDTDSDVNVMTVGNVQVKLQEKQRSEDGSKLVDFVQGKELTPLVGSAQGTKDKWGQPSTEEASNYVDKIVYATNTGKNDAYIRFLVAIPTALIPDTANSSNNPLHWNFGNRVDITGTGKYNKGAYADSDWAKLFKYADVEADGKAAAVTIDGENYWVTYFTMQEALAPGADSLAVMAGLYLDNRVDYDADLGKYTFKGEVINYDLSKGVKIPVMVQAVQADGFKTVDDAFTSAYGEVTVEKAAEWFGGVKAPDVVDVSDLDSLKDALTGEDPVIIDGNDEDLGDLDEVTFKDGTIIRDMTFTGDSNHGSYGNNAYGTVTFINCTFTSDYAYAAHFDGGNGELIFIDCKFEGWNSFGTAITGLTFTNCTFGHNGYYGNARVYQDATFTDCTFESDFEGVDTSVAGTVVHFNNCTGISVDNIYNNTKTDKEGNVIETYTGVWYIDGVDVSDQIKSW